MGDLFGLLSWVETHVQLLWKMQGFTHDLNNLLLLLLWIHGNNPKLKQHSKRFTLPSITTTTTAKLASSSSCSSASRCEQYNNTTSATSTHRPTDGTGLCRRGCNTTVSKIRAWPGNQFTLSERNCSLFEDWIEALEAVNIFRAPTSTVALLHTAYLPGDPVYCWLQFQMSQEMNHINIEATVTLHHHRLFSEARRVKGRGNCWKE